MDSRLAPPLVTPDVFGDAPVVWRRWRVAHEGTGRWGRPLLTGLLGFPWRDGVLEAQCTAIDPTARLGRYHRAVPASTCSCGIYASRHELDSSNLPRSPAREPVVEGFVRLSGRIVEDAESIRAERAEIVGPLLVHPGRRPLWDRKGLASPIEVRRAGNGYRVVWSRSRGSDGPSGLERITTQLAARYGVSVLARNWRRQGR